MIEKQKRTERFARLAKLESLLAELNENLAYANDQYLESSSEQYSKLFVVGPPRSGTTLFNQWLANTGLVAYPTNLLSRFYGAPLVGAKIQQLLTDPQYNFRDEILDFNSPINFSSENGKTKGALAPNEFWYFWRRFLSFGELDYLPDALLREKGNLSGFRDELNTLTNIFEKPFAMKAMIVNQNIAQVAEQFKKSLFIWIQRDPIFNIQSILEARKRQYGDIKTWYSFKIREYPLLKDLDPLESVAGQIAAINKSVSKSFASLPESSKLIIRYEDFCENPELFYEAITHRLVEQDGWKLDGVPTYSGISHFSHTNIWRLDEYGQTDAENAYAVARARD